MNLQNYIEEEIKQFRGEFMPYLSAYPFEEAYNTLINKMTEHLSQSLHRIAKITAKEIVPEKLKPTDTDFPGYKFAIRDLKNKKEQFFG